MARAASLFRCIVDSANQNGRSHGVPVQSIAGASGGVANETASALCHPDKPAALSCDEANRNSSPAVHQNTVGGFSPTQGESSEQGASSAGHSTPYFFTLVAKLVNGTLIRRLFRLWTVWRGMMEQGR